jgi:hypothetical protein
MNVPEYQPMASTGDADAMTRAYLECAEWCELGREDREAFELTVSPKWSADTLKQAAEDCANFREAAGPLLDGMDDEQAGHDFWLTRNHHGAGFWDRGLGETGKRLTELAHPYGEAYVMLDPETEELHLYPS